jgi:hypothetical protein
VITPGPLLVPAADSYAKSFKADLVNKKNPSSVLKNTLCAIMSSQSCVVPQEQPSEREAAGRRVDNKQRSYPTKKISSF